jgi:hypothetical protein
VLGQWRTAASGKTDARGDYSTRGFLGDYEVTVLSGNRKKAAKATLGAPGVSASVVLD